MPVPAVRFRTISQTAMQRESGWRPTQYEVEGSRPRGLMYMSFVGVRQRRHVSPSPRNPRRLDPGLFFALDISPPVCHW